MIYIGGGSDILHDLTLLLNFHMSVLTVFDIRHIHVFQYKIQHSSLQFHSQFIYRQESQNSVSFFSAAPNLNKFFHKNLGYPEMSVRKFEIF